MIIGLIFKLDSIPKRAALALSAALAACGWWFFGACPTSVLRLLQTGSVVLLAVGGRMPQVRERAPLGWEGRLVPAVLPAAAWRCIWAIP